MLIGSSCGEMLAVGEIRAVCETYPAEIDRLDFFVIAATLLETTSTLCSVILDIFSGLILPSRNCRHNGP